jgi:hypothetical protein
MINTKLQSIIDTKSAIGNAIVNKGGTITGETPFFNYAAQIDGISTGTPQTIFQASDGSKWALTNVVNLTNVSNNITYDFNRWQPANNSTSDPIMTVGTVNGNISGNIRIVQVNQVNIAQYGNIVATDTLGGKYVGYNGYDFSTNPTPTGNVVFNRWVLNNSASGTIVFANGIFVNSGTYNGPNTTTNEASIPFVANTASYGGDIKAVTTNNGFIYAVGENSSNFRNSDIRKYSETTLGNAFPANSAVYNGVLTSIAINNGFVYVGGSTNPFLHKYHEGNLAFVGNALTYFDTIFSITVNNGFVYIGGGFNVVSKYHESNLVRVGNTAGYGGSIRSITTNNGFLYVGGDTSGGSESNGVIRKYHESNLVASATSPTYNGIILSLAINNGFVYVGGGNGVSNDNKVGSIVRKYNESTLSFNSNASAAYGGTITSVKINNGFVYAGGRSNQRIQKFYESNLVFLTNSNSYGGAIDSIALNNGFIYAGGDTNRTVQKFQQVGLTPDSQTLYNITKIKE